jgi:hypothetical protein
MKLNMKRIKGALQLEVIYVEFKLPDAVLHDKDYRGGRELILFIPSSLHRISFGACLSVFTRYALL